MNDDDWRAQLQQFYASGVFGGNDGQGQAYVGPQTQQAYAMSGLNRLPPMTSITPSGAGGLQGGLAEAIADALARNRQGGGLLNPYQPPPTQPGNGGRISLPRNPGGGLLGGYM